MNLLKALKRSPLHTKILVGLVSGVPIGLLLGPRAVLLKPLGDIFLRLIWMIVVPLVFSSIMAGTASIGDIRKLGRIGAKTILYYIATTVIAISLGILLAVTLKPGARIGESNKARLLESYDKETAVDIEIASRRPSVVDTLVRIVPRNPFESLSAGEMLQIIFFAIAFGIAASMLPADRGRILIEFFAAASDAMTQLVKIIMKAAPIGVLALVAVVIGRFGAGILISLASYAAIVTAGLFLHMGVVYSCSVKLFSGMSPSTFFRGMRPAQIIAFSSSSSNATLPITMHCVTENLGVPKAIASFVLPLGATINMDGTALYQGVAAVFIAQVYGIHLALSEIVTIVLMATLASIGTAGVPSVGLIMLAMVLHAVGLPLEGIALILGVDRILDMLRTIVNVTGDASAAIMVAATEGSLKREPSPTGESGMSDTVQYGPKDGGTCN